MSDVDVQNSSWIVVKFGGTSVASGERWQRIEQVVRRHRAAGHRVLVVCSAMAGTTNRLERIAAARADGGDWAALVAELDRAHDGLAADLGVAPALLATERAALAAALAGATDGVSPADRATILAHGELVSTTLGAAWLATRGLAAVRLDAREVLRGIVEGDRAERYLSARCAAEADPAARARLDAAGAEVVVTQGFIASDGAGGTVLLGRGGSDASAAYLAAAISADAIEIWTDVPGMFTADPRTAPDARLLRRISYGEAEALGALGAKVLHARTIEPARTSRIPIRIGWTEHPDVDGTRIGGFRPPRGAKAIASRKNLALLTLWRPSSWQPVGFMAEVAARFHRRGLSMDLIASSTSEIRVTIDLAAFPSARDDLDALCADLAEVCEPRVQSRVGCVSVVGAGVVHELFGAGRGFSPFADAAVHLVSHAANGCHVSVVVDEAATDELVAAAHASLLAAADDDSVFGVAWRDLVSPGGAIAAATPTVEPTIEPAIEPAADPSRAPEGPRWAASRA